MTYSLSFKMPSSVSFPKEGFLCYNILALLMYMPELTTPLAVVTMFRITRVYGFFPGDFLCCIIYNEVLTYLTTTLILILITLKRKDEMPGTKEGGRKAAITNKLKHGADFYANIGRRGGQKGHTGGFFNDPERAAICGSIGGKKSKRGPARKKDEK